MLQYNSIELDNCLSFIEKPIATLAKDVRKRCSRAILMVKV